ncbi:hypothetical protein B7P43_G08920 [Cryptotermes secundus]|uniref:Endonuclease/exonuclease/phosphatase domain-containing protein n=1 Tax=Cryptotermes secundus TaxID=105785 RepID=A0A2J7QTF2_9NEOP|nr:hypothetical protein B7P43_G08920 [Cryptotermes secundus]
MDYSLGTWNVKTLNKPGAMKSVLEQIDKYNMKITAIQEIRWLGKGIMDLKKHTICYSGKAEGNKEFGVAFVIEREFKSAIIDFKPISERICTLRIRTKFFNMTLMNVHAPTEEKEEEVKDYFYQQMEETYDSIPSNDIKVILGDLNAKIGKEKEYRGVIGTESLHDTTNHNGIKLIDFAESKNLIISSTYFPHKNIHKRTWAAPDGVTFNQIDHVLIEKRFATNILDVRTLRGANCDSDHYLVQVKYRCKISCQRSKQYEKCKKFNIDKITESDKREAFQNKIKEINDNRANKEVTVEGIWVDFKTAIITEAERTLGYQEKQDNREWFDEECRESINLKNKKYMEYMERPTRARNEAYKEARRKADKICRKKKRAFLNEQLLQLEEDFKNNKTKNAFGRIKYMKEGFKPKTEFIRDKKGLLINNKTEIMNTWKEYFEQLLNQNQNMEDNEDNEEENTDDGEGKEEEIIEPPTKEEVEEALKEQKLNKAPGGDNIPAELLKAGGQEGIIALHRIINKVWEEEKIPED